MKCLTQPIEMQLSRDLKIFSEFFLHFRKLNKTLDTLEKKMSLRGDFFVKL